MILYTIRLAVGVTCLVLVVRPNDGPTYSWPVKLLPICLEFRDHIIFFNDLYKDNKFIKFLLKYRKKKEKTISQYNIIIILVKR